MIELSVNHIKMVNAFSIFYIISLLFVLIITHIPYNSL